MNKYQAYEAGYEFHGCWERSYNRQIAKDKAKELRKLGNKAICVNTDGGVGVYWIESAENIAIREAAEKERKRINIENRILNLKADIASLEKELEQL